MSAPSDDIICGCPSVEAAQHLRRWVAHRTSRRYKALFSKIFMTFDDLHLSTFKQMKTGVTSDTSAAMGNVFTSFGCKFFMLQLETRTG